MESHTENIEFINKYIDKILTEAEVVNFENRLKTDASFKNEFESQLFFLKGLKRQSLKKEIKEGRALYVRHKWFKSLGFAFIVVVGIFICFYLFI